MTPYTSEGIKGGGIKSIFLLFQDYRSIGYLHNITLIFEICLHSGTLGKTDKYAYEHDIL